MAAKPTSKDSFLSRLLHNQILIPLAALLLLAVFNLIADPSFFKITLGHNSNGDPVLSGYAGTRHQAHAHPDVPEHVI